jgi:hypothetical protein
MRRRRLLTLFVLALATTGLLLPATAGAGNGAEATVSTGQTVMARFFNEDTSSCVRPTIFVGAGERMVNTNAPSMAIERGVSAIVFVYDACEGTMRRYNGSVENAAVEISNGLHHARVVANFEAIEFATGDSIEVALDLTWTPTDKARHDHYSGSYSEPGDNGFEVIVNQHSADSWRPAIASGTIAIDGVSREMTTENLATFHSFRSGNVTIVH